MKQFFTITYFMLLKSDKESSHGLVFNAIELVK
jgi:hypothetical protein